MKKLRLFLVALIVILISSIFIMSYDKPIEEPIYATFVSDTGGINDGSFSEGTWNGVQQFAKDYNVEVDYIETTDPAQYETNLQLASDQSNIVVASGFNFSVPIYNIATENPDNKYILIDAEPTNPTTGEIESLPNVKSYYFSEEQAGFIVGYIAGLYTETNKVSFIGGQQIPPVQNFAKGYQDGVKSSNPKATVSIQYSDTWTDTNKVQTMSQTLISQGNDIIFSATGNAGMGAVTTAIEQTLNENQVWIIGCDVDQSDAGIYTKENGEQGTVVLTSALKNVGIAAYQGLEMIYNNEWNNTTEILDLSNGGVGIPESNTNIIDEDETEAYDAAKAHYYGN